MTPAICAVACGLAIGLLPVTPARADQTRDQQWALDFLQIDDAHRISKGKGVTVAIVAGGVDADHPDLAGNVKRAIDRTTTRGSASRANRGTALAALIAGHGHGPDGSAGVLGIAPKAKILPVRVDTRDGIATAVDNANGIQAAVDKGADVVLVFGSGSDAPAPLGALGYAHANDVLVVTPVGDQRHISWSTYSAPPSIVTVAGVSRNGEVSPISARGIRDLGEEISVAAPSDDVISAAPDSGYRTSTSTHNAAALVAGVAALIRSAHPDLDATEVQRRLIDSAADGGPPGDDDGYGAGVVNPQAALAENVPHRPSFTETEPPATSWTESTSESTLRLLVVARAVIMIVLYIVAPGVVIMRLARRWQRRAASDAVHIPVRVAAGRAGRSDPPGYERWPQFRFLVMWSWVLGLVMVTAGVLAGFVPGLLARRVLEERFDLRPPESLAPADSEVGQ